MHRQARWEMLYYKFESVCSNIYIYFINLFIYLFYFLALAVLGFRCCVQAFSSCGEPGLLFVAVHGLLIVVASLVATMGSRHADFSSCGTWAQ